MRLFYLECVHSFIRTHVYAISNKNPPLQSGRHAHTNTAHTCAERETYHSMKSQLWSVIFGVIFHACPCSSRLLSSSVCCWLLHLMCDGLMAVYARIGYVKMQQLMGEPRAPYRTELFCTNTLVLEIIDADQITSCGTRSHKINANKHTLAALCVCVLFTDRCALVAMQPRESRTLASLSAHSNSAFCARARARHAPSHPDRRRRRRRRRTACEQIDIQIDLYARVRECVQTNHPLSDATAACASVHSITCE